MPPRPTRTNAIDQTPVDPAPADLGTGPPAEGAPPIVDRDGQVADAPAGAPAAAPADAAPDAGGDTVVTADPSAPAAEQAPVAAESAGQSDRPVDDGAAAREAEASYQDNQRLNELRPLTIDLES